MKRVRNKKIYSMIDHFVIIPDDPEKLNTRNQHLKIIMAFSVFIKMKIFFF